MTIAFRCFSDAEDSSIASHRSGAIRDKFREVVARAILLSRPKGRTEIGFVDARIKGLNVHESPVKAYWKVRGWYEAAFEASVPRGTDAHALLREVARGFADKWDWLSSGTNAIASESSKSAIKVPGVHWIELELVGGKY